MYNSNITSNKFKQNVTHDIDREKLNEYEKN